MNDRDPSPQALAAAQARVRRLARGLDAAVRIPGTRIRIGLDAVIGLVPVAGDLLALALSALIVFEGLRAGAPPRLLGRMLLNLGIDTAVGAIPVLGDVFDIAFKANVRNARLLEAHLGERAGTAPAHPPSPGKRRLQAAAAAAVLLAIAALAVIAFRALLATL